MKNEASPENRLLYIDIARAVAILLVTFYHIAVYMRVQSWSIPGFELNRILRLGNVGVELFFVVSGYCMAMSVHKAFRDNRFEYIDYMKKRLWRILPPFYVAIVVWCILEALVNLGGIHARTSPYDVITHLVFMHNLRPDTIYSISGVMWSLAVEMQFYLFMPFIYRAYSKTPWLTMIGAVALSLGINLWLYRFVRFPNLLNMSVLSYIVLFVLGIALHHNRERLKELFQRPSVIALYIVVLAWAWLSNSAWKWLHRNEVHDIVLGMLFSLMLVFLNNTKVNSSKFLAATFGLIGAASYSIYLYNHIMYITTKPVVTGIEGCAYYALLTIFFGILMYALVEKPVLIMRAWIIRKGKAASS